MEARIRLLVTIF